MATRDDGASLLERLHLSALDLRLAIMAAVLVVMAVVFHVLSGDFLTPENLYNIVQQTAVTGIVATAVSLVIVARHIDLSVGSVMGFVGVLIAWLMYTQNWAWPAASAVGLLAAILVGLYHGGLTAYLGVPSFVVTLGGLMSFRGAAFLVANGKTQPITDETFLMLGGGIDGALGIVGSWALAGAVAALAAWRMVVARRARARHSFASRPLVVDLGFTLALIAGIGVFTAAMCAYQLPGKPHGQGIPVPVVIWGTVVLCVAFLVRRTRFGRYVFAIGGNPEAARLVGIPVRKVTLQLFALLAVTVTIAAVVAVARLNAGTNSLGTGLELYVIAAAVIGGVSLGGGSGSVLGSVLGALIIQFLDSGLLLLDVGIGQRMIIIGQVLIVAVAFDVLYRRFSGERI